MEYIDNVLPPEKGRSRSQKEKVKLLRAQFEKAEFPHFRIVYLKDQQDQLYSRGGGRIRFPSKVAIFSDESFTLETEDGDFGIEPNTLVFTQGPSEVGIPWSMDDLELLVFESTIVRKGTYKKNLLAELAKGRSSILSLILGYLEIQDLRTLYLNNPPVLKFLMSGNADSFLRQYWLEYYGEEPGETPFKSISCLEQNGNEIDDIIKYNAYKLYKQYVLTEDVDYVDLMKVAARYDRDIIFRDLLDQGNPRDIYYMNGYVGLKCGKIAIEVIPEKDEISEYLFALCVERSNLQLAKYILETQKWNCEKTKIKKTLEVLRDRSISEFIDYIFKWKILDLDRAYIRFSEKEASGVLVDFCDLIVRELPRKYYNKVIKYYQEYGIWANLFEINLDFCEYLLDHKVKVSEEVDLLELGKPAIKLLKQHGYSKAIEKAIRSQKKRPHI